MREIIDEIKGVDGTRAQYLEEIVLSSYDLRGHMGGFQFEARRDLELILNLLFQWHFVLWARINVRISGESELSYHFPNFQVFVVCLSKACNPTGHHFSRRNAE